MNRLFRLWAGRSIDPARIPLPGHISHHVIRRADERYRFLLGADIADFGGTLFCGWGNSRRDENDRWSVMRGCRSGDGGRSWGAAERISPPLSRGFSCSHGVFFPCGGRLHALVPQARYGIPGVKITGKLCNSVAGCHDIFPVSEKKISFFLVCRCQISGCTVALLSQLFEG